MKSFLWRHKILIVIWIVVFAMAGYFGYILFFKYSGGENPYLSSDNTDQSDSQTVKSASQTKTIGIGETAQDGNLEFTVKGQTCNGETTIGENQYAEAEAEGSFCRVTISIKNLGQQLVDLPLEAQKGYVNDNPIPVDKKATEYAQTDQSKAYWYSQIMSGNSASGDLVFELHGNEKLSIVELHETANSPGIKVNL